MFQLYKNLRFIALLSALCLAPFSFADDRVGYPSSVPYEEGADIRKEIKNECQLDTKLVIFLGKYLKGNGYVSTNPAEGKYLDMRITGVRTAGGGFYSGPKWMEVVGTLNENGKAGPSFRAKRFTRGGGMRACYPAQKCSKAIAKDIFIWLKNPVDGAELGDAK